MENEQVADEILAAVEQLLQAAGPEWTLQFLQAGIEEAGAGGGEMQPEMMPQRGMGGGMGGMGAMPPAGPKRNALAM